MSICDVQGAFSGRNPSSGRWREAERSPDLAVPPYDLSPSPLSPVVKLEFVPEPADVKLELVPDSDGGGGGIGVGGAELMANEGTQSSGSASDVKPGAVGREPMRRSSRTATATAVAKAASLSQQRRQQQHQQQHYQQQKHQQPQQQQQAGATVKRCFPWSDDEFRAWQGRAKWLFRSQEGIGCAICREASVVVYKRQGVFLAKEWRAGMVWAKDKKKLRKKVYEHRDTKAHRQASYVSAVHETTRPAPRAPAPPPPRHVVDSKSRLFSETERAFRTAYLVAKEDLRACRHDSLCALQELDGARLGRAGGTHGCLRIIAHVRAEMEAKLTAHLVGGADCFSVLVDGCSFARRRFAAVLVRARVGAAASVDNALLDLVRLPDGASAEEAARAVVRRLEDKLGRAALDDRLLAGASEGPSADIPALRGIGAHFQKAFPRLLLWLGCVAHRLERDASRCLLASGAADRLGSLVTASAELCARSPRNAGELAAAAPDFGAEVARVAAVTPADGRHAASTFACARAAWRGYTALHTHFARASADPSRAPDEREAYQRLRARLESAAFVRHLAAAKDALRELRALAGTLQDARATACDALWAVRRAIAAVASLRDGGGKSLNRAEQRLADGLFKGVVVDEDDDDGGGGGLDTARFYQMLANVLMARFPVDAFELVSVLDPKLWKRRQGEDNAGDGKRPPSFEEDEVARLARRLRLPPLDCASQFRSRRCGAAVPEGGALSKLEVAIATLPTCSAECARVTAALADVAASRQRADSLLDRHQQQQRRWNRKQNHRIYGIVKEEKVDDDDDVDDDEYEDDLDEDGDEHLANLLWIKCNGPPLEWFDARPLVRSWLLKQQNAEARRDRPVESGGPWLEPRELWTLLS
ncbi:uncharacterized protein LOC133355951 [Lethenteron reissneri]|uniref:uncharacterized protein LOC133355951 n=1 Tax=Lethenteron reissneri TaxID=7753 RepID=UPI002AB5E06B|nr:uncharacterized protein LOC133355951 [Lethenteron reissneri]XP_061429391.1 uncharacterized protein LOC133355951 [Lethenteron reissneri]XP_061429392.1 uncharacterized protein LOC133355951 [Lethenteron reissneri]